MSFSSGPGPYWPNGGSKVHEVGVVSEAASRFLAAVGDRRVAEVILDLGPGMEQGVVEAAWDHVMAGTPAARAIVRWERVADTLLCFGCSATYHGSKLDICPVCEGNGLVVEQAPEISVRSWRGAD